MKTTFLFVCVCVSALMSYASNNGLSNRDMCRLVSMSSEQNVSKAPRFIDSNSFYRKHPRFGNVTLAFTSEFSSMSDKYDDSKVNKLINKYIKDYESDYYGSIKRDERDFMYNELRNVADSWIRGERAKEQQRKKEAEEKAREVEYAQKQKAAMDEWAEKAKQSSIFEEQCVDLGLSVYWCGYNFGANNSGEYGDYYLWGEYGKKPRDGWFESLNYRRDYDNLDLNSGNIKLTFYDVVDKSWGQGWHIPTQAEMQELVDKCYIYTCKYRGQTGLKVYGPSGKSIFIPAYNGVKYLLSSYKYYKSERVGKMIPDVAEGACLEIGKQLKFGGISRDYTGLIRPVKSKSGAVSNRVREDGERKTTQQRSQQSNNSVSSTTPQIYSADSFLTAVSQAKVYNSNGGRLYIKPNGLWMQNTMVSGFAPTVVSFNSVGGILKYNMEGSRTITLMVDFSTNIVMAKISDGTSNMMFNIK